AGVRGRGPGGGGLRQQARPGRLPEPAAQPVAVDRAAQPPAHRDAHPPATARARGGKRDDRPPCEDALRPHDAIEVLAAPEPVAPLHGATSLPSLAWCELGAALPAAVPDDPPAPRRVHAMQESVDAPTVPLLRLIRALDGRPLWSRIFNG